MLYFNKLILWLFALYLIIYINNTSFYKTFSSMSNVHWWNILHVRYRHNRWCLGPHYLTLYSNVYELCFLISELFIFLGVALKDTVYHHFSIFLLKLCSSFLGKWIWCYSTLNDYVQTVPWEITDFLPRRNSTKE